MYFFQVPSKGVKGQNSRNFLVSKIPLVGSLSLCLKTPDSTQKKLTQSDHPTRRKRPNVWKFWVICRCPKSTKFNHILDVFSSWGGRIELNPFALIQASGDTSLDYLSFPFLYFLSVHIMYIYT